MNYICFNRFEGLDLSAHRVKVPYGTPMETKGRIVYFPAETLVPVCTTTSDVCHAHFARDDDGFGIKRGKLIEEIRAKTDAPTTPDKTAWAKHDLRWSRIWDAKDLYVYNKTPLGDHWTWNDDFYNAPIDALEDILKIIE